MKADGDGLRNCRSSTRCQVTIGWMVRINKYTSDKQSIAGGQSDIGARSSSCWVELQVPGAGAGAGEELTNES